MRIGKYVFEEYKEPLVYPTDAEIAEAINKGASDIIDTYSAKVLMGSRHHREFLDEIPSEVIARYLMSKMSEQQTGDNLEKLKNAVKNIEAAQVAFLSGFENLKAADMSLDSMKDED